MNISGKFPFASTLLILLLLLLTSYPARAAEFRVNATVDLNDLTPGNGLCVAFIIVIIPAVWTFCTLRAAIQETNELPGPDTILVPAGTYSLDIQGILENESLTGDLDVTDTLTIRGEGADKTIIDARGIDRVLDLPTWGTSLTLENLTLTNGSLPPSLHWTKKGGGGIRNRGHLTLRNVIIRNNHVSGTSSGDAGGGLFNYAQCTVSKTTIENNSAGRGGGVYNFQDGTFTLSESSLLNNTSNSGGGLRNDGTLKIINSTISGNNTRIDQAHDGGGVFNEGNLDVIQATIASNSASGSGGGIWNQGRLSLINTILADNEPGNCNPSAALLSLGHNLESDNTCQLDASADLLNAEAKLAPLTDNGGPTKTHALIIGSPAIDSGQDLSAEGITVDQRGKSRPDGGGYDIGSYETRKKIPPAALQPLLP